MSAPAQGYVKNPQPGGAARHPFLQISNRPGSAFSRLMADPAYRAILFRDNAKALAAAGYTHESVAEREREFERGNSLLTASGERNPTAKIVVRHKGVRSPAGWHETAKKLQRGKLPAHCLLEPAEGKYPVCDEDTALDCEGVIAAQRRAHINAVHGVPGAKHVETTAKNLYAAYCSSSSSSSPKTSTGESGMSRRDRRRAGL
jgi:hypothetical protein